MLELLIVPVSFPVAFASVVPLLGNDVKDDGVEDDGVDEKDNDDDVDDCFNPTPIPTPKPTATTEIPEITAITMTSGVKSLWKK